MVNILKNRLYVYDGILDNLNDAVGMVDLSISSLSVLNNVLLELNNNVANISNPHTTEGSITNLRDNCNNLVNEFSGVVFHSRYNENKVLIDDENPEEPNKDSVDFNYSLPGVNDEIGASRDNFTFKPPRVGSAKLPSLPIKIKSSDGNEVKDADGGEINFKLENLSKDMNSKEDITNTEIRHRAAN
jgi:flagellin-like hook-associated protein FlgL